MQIGFQLKQILIFGAMLLITGCATTVETTLNKEWEKPRVFNSDEDKLLTQMQMTDEGDAVTLISPSGVQTINENGEIALEMDRDSFFSVHVETSRGVERLTDKVSYIYLPHRHALLEFNYATFAESVTMIDLNENSVQWVTKDLKWSLERYQTFARALTKGLGLGGQLTADAASGIMAPKRFVENLTKVIPELDAFVFKTLDGLALIALEDGSIIWNNEDFKGGLAELIYEPDSNSLVAVNRDDDAFSIEGLQFNKQIMRLDAETGATIWSGTYDGNIREKLDGFGIWGDRKTDIRLADGKIMINFLNVEVYDFESGEQLWQTTTGNDKLLDLVAPEAQIMNLFAFPVIHENILYRVNHENVGLTGVDVVVQAFDYETGNLKWKTDKLSRSKAVNDMLVVNDNLIVSLDREDKVLAFDRVTGEKAWEKSGFGKNGILFEMMELDGIILAAGSDKIQILNADNGDEIISVNSADNGLGNMTDFTILNEQIMVAGENGFGSFDPDDGSLISSIELPTGGLIQVSEDENRILISPKPAYSDASYSVDGAFHLINSSNAELLGTLGTDKDRRNWKISPDYKNIYELKDEVIIMYSAD
ncbi:MAG: PQQ-binding-like beta-propeller repeat protein [Balneolaceae bacterium]